MRILGLDPGTARTGWVVYDTERSSVLLTGNNAGDELQDLEWLKNVTKQVDVVALEKPVNYNRKNFYVSSHMDRMLFFCGRIHYVVHDLGGKGVVMVYRSSVKSLLCPHNANTDAGVTQGLYLALGGSRDAARGTKERPGPMHGVVKDAIQALGVAFVAATSTVTRKACDDHLTIELTPCNIGRRKGRKRPAPDRP